MQIIATKTFTLYAVTTFPLPLLTVVPLCVVGQVLRDAQQVSYECYACFNTSILFWFDSLKKKKSGVRSASRKHRKKILGFPKVFFSPKNTIGMFEFESKDLSQSELEHSNFL